MLQLSTETLNIEGVTIYRDHAIENQFWYHEQPVALAKRNGKPQFTLITYRPSVAGGDAKGGGFLMLESEIKMEPRLKQKIKAKLAGVTDKEPRLAPIPYDDGDVQIMALDLQGSGGTEHENLEPGSFVAVEKIFGASKPSLSGSNNAVFGLKLSQEGAQLMEAAFKAGGMPVGIIYSLKYTALQPAISARIEANYKRMYDHFSMGIDLTAGGVIGGVPVYLEAGLDFAFEKLVEQKIIKVKITNFSTEDDRAEKEKMILDFFKDTMIKDWFQPTLQPIPHDQPNPNPVNPGNPGVPNPGAPNPGAPNPGAPNPGAPNPGAPNPGAPNPGAPNPGAPNPGAPNPGAPNPGAPNPGAPNPGAPNPGAPNPGAPNPGAPNPGAPNPGAPNPGAPNPGAPNPGAPNPGAPNPGAPNPGAPNPGAPNPGAPNPDALSTQSIAASQHPHAITSDDGAQLDVSTEPPVGVRLAFSLRKVNQQEDKFAVLEYDRADAVQRVHGAQGLIGILAGDLDDAHFLKVDLDSTFFRSVDITAEAPDNIFDSLGLTAVDVAIDYGDEDDEDHIKHKDFRFQANGEKKGEISFFLNRSLDLHYSLSTQYHFDPLSGWEGEKISYDMPTRPTMDRTLMVNPFNDLGFMQIQIAAADMDTVMMDSTNVHMVYDDGDWRTEKVFKVSPSGEDQVWKLRLSKPEHRKFSYHLVHHLANGDTIVTEEKQQVASLVPVSDPFEDPLVIEFFPNYDGANIQQVFIDITYADQANDYHRKERVMFSGEERDSKSLRFARMNTELGEFSYKVTILGTDNSVRRIPEVTTDESLVFLGSSVGQG